MGKRGDGSDALSARDKAICDGFLAGLSRPKLGEQYGITRQRVGQILHQPHAIAYMLLAAGNTKALLYAKLGEELLTRAEWGGVKLGDVLAIWKAAMPQELTVNHQFARQEAERVAAELGLSVDEVMAEARAILAGAS